MGRKPCCNKEEVTKGAWTTEEDSLLKEYISANGEGKWRSMPLSAGLKRCGKSCRLRWFNYLKPGTKRGNITLEEEDIIIELHKKFGNRWSLIASRLPARTDNEIKNYWNTTIKRKLLKDGSKLDILPKSKKPVRRVPTVKAESNIITPKKSPDSEIAVSNDSTSAKETSSLTSFWERLLRHLELGVITVDEMWSGGEPSSTTFSKDTGEKRSVNTSDSFGCNIDEVWDQNVDISAFTSNDQCEWFKWIDSSEVESISSVLNEDPE